MITLKCDDDDSFYAKNADTPINRLHVVGTHDSAAYKLMCGNIDNKTVKILNPLRAIFPCVNSVIKDWTLTQKYNVGKQLALGIRALDFRVTYKPSSQKFFFTHTFFCVEATDVLKQIKLHIDSHSTSFLFILIKVDFEQSSTFGIPQYNSLKLLVNEMLGGSNFILKSDLKNTTVFPSLKECILGNKHVLCGFTDQYNNPEDFIWGGEFFNGGWIQELNDDIFYQDIKTFVEASNDPYYVNRINHLPLVKTPTMDVITLDAKSRLKLCFYKKENIEEWSKISQMVVDHLNSDNVDGSGMTIFWVDYFK